ncbi:MAG: ArdC family protein [bacterium]
MKKDKARELTDKALTSLVAALEAGKSDTLRAYLSAMSRFHRYSFGNLMLIAMQRPDATQVAGFHTWRKFDRFVRKGEKGIMILAPITNRRKDEDLEPECEGYEVLGYRAVHIFDVSQTDGEPLPQPEYVAGNPGEFHDRLNTFIASCGISLEYSSELTVEGCSSGGKITIRTDLPPAHDFEVRVHELAHELLHRCEGERASKTVRETEAEAVAFVVCHAIGFDAGTACSDYIQLYNGDKDTLAESLQRIQSTSAAILNALEAV